MIPFLSLFTETEVRELLKRASTRSFGKGQATFTGAVALKAARLKFVSRARFKALLASRSDLFDEVIVYLCGRPR